MDAIVRDRTVRGGTGQDGKQRASRRWSEELKGERSYFPYRVTVWVADNMKEGILKKDGTYLLALWSVKDIVICVGEDS